MVGVFGTMVADVTHVALGVPYAVSTPVFLTALVAVFVLWRHVEGTVDVHTIISTSRQLFYWAAVITTFAMGTAAGDLAASTFHLGYFSGGLVFVAAMIVVVLARATSVLGPVTAFWTAYVLTRPIGASFVDYTAVPDSRGGLNAGTGLVSAILLITIAAAVASTTWKRNPRVPVRRCRFQRQSNQDSIVHRTIAGRSHSPKPRRPRRLR
jgi:uncharacterized membrane-anchored protein